jgi:hypothetical protein
MCRGEQALLFGSNNGAGQDANSVRDLQLYSKLYKLWAEFLVVRAHNGKYSGWGTGECTKQPIEAFLPTESAKEQHERLF